MKDKKVNKFNSFAFTEKWWIDKKQTDEIRFMPQFGL
jgi:hypothetical protein